MATKRRIPYAERSDAQKIIANWTKTRGLLSRGEYSMAVVRAAIAVELAANLAIRAHYAAAKTPEEINQLLYSANGLRGKFQKHLLHNTKNTPSHAEMKDLNNRCLQINDERNSICHSGVFKNKAGAKLVIQLAHEVIMAIVPKYEPAFVVKAI